MSPDEEKRCEAVLCAAFHGMHHCPPIKKTPHSWSVNAYGGIATQDFDMLTVLVFSAHDHGVRVEVSHSGPRLVKLTLCARRHRKGSTTSCHPTLEDRVKKWRDCGHVSVALPDDDPQERVGNKSLVFLSDKVSPRPDDGPRETILPNQAVPYVQITEECFLPDHIDRATGDVLQ